jgi:cytochrome c-type biogenesis protein CcmH/NrfF
MFQWIPEGNGEGSGNNNLPDTSGSSSPVVSRWFWLYWAIAAPLTIMILILWMLWLKRTQRHYRERQEHYLSEDEESRIE